MENDSINYYEKGRVISEEIEKYTEHAMGLTGDDREKIQEKIIELNKQNDELKDEIYNKAKEKSGLDYSKQDKNPEILRKEHNENLSQIKKRKQELRLERIRIEKANAERESRINEQFKIASEKYKMMLDAGKITQELYESRMQSMDKARLRDLLDLDDPLVKIKKEYYKLDKEESNIKNKLEELEKNEIIYNEYGDVYYRLFGEVLSDRNKMEKSEIDNKKVDKENSENVGKENKSMGTGEVKNNDSNPAKNNFAIPKSCEQKESAKTETSDKQEKKVEPEVIITSKIMFNELYKKMKKGTITDKEMNALVEVLEDKDSYDKYGITTGLVFNKAKKILKYQGARTAKNIEKFLRDNGKFSEDIRFNAGIEKGNVISHDILNSWKNIDEKLTYTDAVFSVEKYIEQIEKYKENGNELTNEQEQMLSSAIDLKKQITSYRKAINTSEDVGMDRNNKTHNSIFYQVFKNKVKSNSARALPEKTQERTDPGFIVMENLSSMVNSAPTPEEINAKGKTSSRSKDEKDIHCK